MIEEVTPDSPVLIPESLVVYSEGELKHGLYYYVITAIADKESTALIHGGYGIAEPEPLRGEDRTGQLTPRSSVGYEQRTNRIGREDRAAPRDDADTIKPESHLASLLSSC